MAQPIKNAEEHIARLPRRPKRVYRRCAGRRRNRTYCFQEFDPNGGEPLRLSGVPGQRTSYDVRIADQWAPGQPRLANARVL